MSDVPLLDELEIVQVVIDNDNTEPMNVITDIKLISALRKFQDYLNLLDKIEKDNNHFNYDGCSKWDKQFQKGFDMAYHDTLNDIKNKFIKIFGVLDSQDKNEKSVNMDKVFEDSQGEDK